jgi:type II secretory ATPase GspE/PulE/Tfp pilus assembly ATPase PilB-like protein
MMDQKGHAPQVKELEDKIAYQEKIPALMNQIHSATNLNEIFLEIKNKILEFFDADRITIYAIDMKQNQIYSKFKDGAEVKEIRVPISEKSIAGFVAAKKKAVNIKNAYDDNELGAISPSIRFDRTWDQASNYKTTQLLTVPMVFQKNGKNLLSGVIQLVNKKNGDQFTEGEERNLRKIGSALGIAINNQHKMTRRRPSKFDYLVEQTLITENDFSGAITEARAKKIELHTHLMERFNISKEDIGKALSHYYHTPYVGFDKTIEIDRDLAKGLRLDYLKKRGWTPFMKKDGKTIILIDDPNDLAKIDEVRSNMQFRNCEFQVSLKEDILKYIDAMGGTPPQDDDDEEVHVMDDVDDSVSITDVLSSMEEEGDFFEEEDDAVEMSETDSDVVKLANLIIREAYTKGASDIHVEPYTKKDMIIRLRVDGICGHYTKVPSIYTKALVSRLKIMSQLDIAERRKPQDGKIKFRMGKKDIELRVATLPTVGGNEDVVMRILAASEPIPLEKMGMSERNYREFVEVIQKPYGIVLVVGPTGSGKTTTLHSGLGYINKPERKIWTAEDPVEITQYGLRQVQVQPKIGFTFAAAMRAFLRADPDVIMVGEMRDEETAETGIEASLTGHLVFSTLHTNSAPETITRLLEMGMDPFNFADALLGVLAQRLVRTLCSKCKEPYNPSKDEFGSIAADYGEEHFSKLGIEYSKDLTLYRPKGCETCNDTGFKGRMGIHEFLVGTDEIKVLIQKKSVVDVLREQAMKDGMTTLLQDGIEKSFQGHTDIKQVRSVCIK